ncbi:MAG: hypothetical protein JXB32_20000, partial [Deltaproteobacteria bacterium]|nr:hypothetical protein [Deltaproteobacteria bacterium]
MTRQLAMLWTAAALGTAACSPGDDSTDVVPRDDGALETADDASPADADADTGADLPAEAEAGADADGDVPGPDADADADVPSDALCPVVPEPAPIPQQAIAGEAPWGRHEATTVDGFHDEYLYDATDYLKIGLRREWGGTIVFFGIAAGHGAGINATNSIDANDTGREVQVAFYDPDRHMQNCAWNASCRTTPSSCPASITFLGWDPVQGGNRCNRGSGVESVDFADGVLRAVTNPLFWNPNWDRTDCVSDNACTDPALRERRSDVRVTQSLRFVATHVVQLEYAVENLAALDHAATAQEMPTVYTANGTGGADADLWQVVDSEGRQVVVDTPAGGDGFMYENFDS